MCMRERRIYIKDRDNVWFKKQEYMIWTWFILRKQYFTNFTMLDNKMNPSLPTLDLNPRLQLRETRHFPNALASLLDYLTSYFVFLITLFSLDPLSSLHCPLFICAPMHTMYVRVQDMHAMHDRHLAYMHYMWCMLEHSFIWALMYENAPWISTMMKIEL